jgi:hypothetical protein
LYCLPMFYRAARPSDYRKPYSRTIGLIVSTWKFGQRHGEYQRVGTFRATKDVADLLGSESKHGIPEFLSESEYDEFDGVDQYTIFLV